MGICLTTESTNDNSETSSLEMQSFLRSDYANSLWNDWVPYSCLYEVMKRDEKNSDSSREIFYDYFRKEILGFKGIKQYIEPRYATKFVSRFTLIVLTLFDRFIYEQNYYNILDFDREYKLFTGYVNGEELKEKQIFDRDFPGFELEYEKRCRRIAEMYLQKLRIRMGTLRLFKHFKPEQFLILKLDKYFIDTVFEYCKDSIIYVDLIINSIT